MKLKTVLVSPDKFKGSLTAEQFCEIARDEIKKFDEKIEVIVFFKKILTYLEILVYLHK